LGDLRTDDLIIDTELDDRANLVSRTSVVDCKVIIPALYDFYVPNNAVIRTVPMSKRITLVDSMTSRCIHPLRLETVDKIASR